MNQTSNTAIVLRYANYRENDRMLTLFSPTRGLVEAVARGCRRPKSKLLSASELFALGEFELFEKDGRYTVTGFTLTENFYALREDWERLNCGVYLLSLCEAAVQPGENAQELFMLLLHTLSRLTFTDQPWKPLLTGFLAHLPPARATGPGWRTVCAAGGAWRRRSRPGSTGGRAGSPAASTGSPACRPSRTGRPRFCGWRWRAARRPGRRARSAKPR